MRPPGRTINDRRWTLIWANHPPGVHDDYSKHIESAVFPEVAETHPDPSRRRSLNHEAATLTEEDYAMAMCCAKEMHREKEFRSLNARGMNAVELGKALGWSPQFVHQFGRHIAIHIKGTGKGRPKAHRHTYGPDLHCSRCRKPHPSLAEHDGCGCCIDHGTGEALWADCEAA